MNVRIDEKPILKVCKKTDRLGLLLLPEDGAAVSNVDIDAAIHGVRLPFFADQPLRSVETAAGIAIFAGPYAGPAHGVQVAREIAAAVETIGFKGTVTACDADLGRGLRRTIPSLSAILADSEIVFDTRPGTSRSAGRLVPDARWAVESPSFSAFVGALMAWAGSVGADHFRAGAGLSRAECRPEQIEKVLARSCEALGNGYVTFDSRLGECVVGLDDDGYVLVDVERGKDDQAVLEELESLITVLAPQLDYACILPSIWGLASAGTAMALDLGRIPPPGYARAMQDDHKALRTRVPDIFGIQMLGPGHGNLRPPEEWTVKELPGNRRLVFAQDYLDWIRPTFQAPLKRLLALRDANADILLMEIPYVEIKPQGPGIKSH